MKVCVVSKNVPGVRGTRCRLLRVVASVIVGMLVLVACGGEEPAPDPEPEPVEEPTPEPGSVEEPEPEPVEEEETDTVTGPTSFLTGKEVEEPVLDRPILIVKVDNAPQARPQTGLERADIVMEIRVEAGITRFLAVFHSEIPDDVGPTRSARPADAQLVSGFGRSAFIYSGARPEVQNLMANASVIRITEGGPGFHRVGGRPAPHNLHTRLPQALDAVRDRDPDILTSIGWVFDDEAPAGEEACPPADADCEDPGQWIEYNVSSNHRIGWEYDAEAELYRHHLNGQRSTVTGDGRIGAANVVVLGARHYLGEPNCHGARCPETDATTEGADAIVLRDGKRYRAIWRKPTAADPIEILTPDGEPFPLKPGRTWISLPDASNLPAPVGGGS